LSFLFYTFLSRTLPSLTMATIQCNIIQWNLP